MAFAWVLPLVAFLIVTAGSGLATALRELPANRLMQRRILPAFSVFLVALGLGWSALASATVWPEGLCYTNELWGGTKNGWLTVSDSNYDWGQGLRELAKWQKQQPGPLDVWYFGSDPLIDKMPVHEIKFHLIPVAGPEDVLARVRGHRLAVSTTLLRGSFSTLMKSGIPVPEECTRVIIYWTSSQSPARRRLSSAHQRATRDGPLASRNEAGCRCPIDVTSWCESLTRTTAQSALHRRRDFPRLAWHPGTGSRRLNSKGCRVSPHISVLAASLLFTPLVMRSQSNRRRVEKNRSNHHNVQAGVPAKELALVVVGGFFGLEHGSTRLAVQEDAGSITLLRPGGTVSVLRRPHAVRKGRKRMARVRFMSTKLDSRCPGSLVHSRSSYEAECQSFISQDHSVATLLHNLMDLSALEFRLVHGLVYGYWAKRPGKQELSQKLVAEALRSRKTLRGFPGGRPDRSTSPCSALLSGTCAPGHGPRQSRNTSPFLVKVWNIIARFPKKMVNRQF